MANDATQHRSAHAGWEGRIALLGLGFLAPLRLNAGEAITPDCNWRAPIDLQPCIQAAIQKAALDGGVVLIPNGRWPLGGPLAPASGVTLKGESPNATLIPSADNRSKPMLLHGRDVRHVAIVNITFEGGGKDFANANPVIEFAKSDDVTLSGIAIQHSHGIGLVMEGGIRHGKVVNSTFNDLGNRWKTTHQRADRIQGVVFCCGDNSQNEADDNSFEDIGLDALQFSNQSQFKILRNTFDLDNQQRKTLPSDDYPAAIFLTYSSGGLIQENTIKGALGNGIDAPALQSSVIENNNIRNCGQAAIGIFPGYDKVTQSKLITIRGNVLMNNVQWGKMSTFRGGITIAGGAPEQILVERNIATDDQSGKTQDYGLMISGGTQVRGLELKNNDFDKNRVSAVYAREGMGR
jgi:parallel beta helix pectate lyase-like protein